jgi:hypothetical protein
VESAIRLELQWVEFAVFVLVDSSGTLWPWEWVGHGAVVGDEWVHSLGIQLPWELVGLGVVVGDGWVHS